jgi:ribonuclease P protein subunit POP4
LIGISGKVIDESQNILFISHKNQSKAVPKTSSIFQFKLPNGFIVEVNGKQIAGRPEDRVKKAVRRRW